MKRTAIILLSTLLIGSGCVDGPAGRARSYEELQAQAETAVKLAGGVELLGKEARTVLSQFGARQDHYSWPSGPTDETESQSIMKLQSDLAPLGHKPWIVPRTQKIPAHVTVRFGTHSRYAYVWIFDPDDPPVRNVEGIIKHVGGGVYLSKTNE